MPKQCQRPDCSDPASVVYRFDAAAQLVVLEALAEDDSTSSVLCSRHAAAMVLPKGWWLDDQRVEVPTLFTPRQAGATARAGTATPPRVRRPRRPRAPANDPVDDPPLPIIEAPAPAPVLAEVVLEVIAVVEERAVIEAEPDEDVADAPAAAAPVPEPVGVAADELGDDDTPSVPAWTPNFDSLDDMESLNVTSPLLSRAFGAKGSQGARKRRAGQ